MVIYEERQKDNNNETTKYIGTDHLLILKKFKINITDTISEWWKLML